MTDSTVASTHRPPRGGRTGALDPAELRGRASGITVGAVMGLTWAASGLGALSPVVRFPLLAVGVAVFAVLMAGARRLRRTAAATLPVSEWPSTEGNRMRRLFAVVLVAEFAAIGAALNLLVGSGHSDWVPAVVCAVVGVHFIPLARLFGVGVYYVTAAALCVVTAVTFIVGAATGSASAWHLLPGLGAAVTLWVTSARLLATTPTPPA